MDVRTEFKTFLKSQQLGIGSASLMTSQDLPAEFSSHTSLGSLNSLDRENLLLELGKNTERTVFQMRNALSLNSWTERIVSREFPKQAVQSVQIGWILSRLALLSVFEDLLPWTKDPSQIRVSLAHSAKKSYQSAALAIGSLNHNVGCDIEYSGRKLDIGVINQINAIDTTRAIQSLSPLTRWTLKESAFKADQKNHQLAKKNSSEVAGVLQGFVLDYQVDLNLGDQKITLTHQDQVWMGKTTGSQLPELIMSWALPAPKRGAT